MDEIDELRMEIDEIDEDILKLIEERLIVAKKIGQIKRSQGLEIYDPKREEEILDRISSKTSLQKDFINKIFKDIMEYCRKNE